ncbi:hypothetical protein [Marinoscillum furvescens]|uniref:Uncharacterized protein n=1 Tax=Marinoscillum furvescens DSM 4134 TaxID=1122208 RepID=A0A3D9KZZ7_MARFU|nr:hypothetical protein [Marinoscillum furvescens]RED94130.1 hypothetical protein C7460_12271 [Marinoscillum furvescens DSM 4134]
MHAYYILLWESSAVIISFDAMKEENPEFVPIEKAFHSFETDAPFSHCLECEKYLLDEGTNYLIEKAVRNYQGFRAKDVIFDYAICLECAQELQKGISKESLSVMQDYMQRHFASEGRLRQLQESQGNIPGLIEQCMVTGKSADTCEEYQIFAFCSGDKINLTMPPYMVSGQVLDELQELLSDSTRDHLNGFFNKHFTPAPGLMEPDPRFILL